MYKTTFTNTSFARGEISPHLLARGDFAEFRNSAMRLKNFRVMSTGGIVRRPGTVFVAKLDGPGRLVSFNHSPGNEFILVFGNARISIYNLAGRLVDTLASPFMEEHFPRICSAQKGDELYLTHPDVPPRIIAFSPVGGKWSIRAWVFKNIPRDYFGNDPDDKNEIPKPPPPSGGGNGGGDNGGGGGGPIVIGRSFSAEPAFSSVRGWPTSCTFHQDRLVIGGSKSLPNRIWFSKTGDYLNFDLGEGLDDEAIEFNMLSDRMNDISTVFAGKHLQVFTSDSEWIVAGQPLTPTSVALREQTKVGSSIKRLIKPSLVEGSTIFVSKNGREIREFFYGETEGGYRSDDLIILSGHLMSDPVEQDYDIAERILYVVQGDGSIAALSLNRTMGISAWYRYETDGEFAGLSISAGRVFFIVRRGGDYFLEHFSDDGGSDCPKTETFGKPVDFMDGLGHLEGREVVVNADGYVEESVVKDGRVKLSHPARTIAVGLPYSHTYCPLPAFIGRARPPRMTRLVELVVRVFETPLLSIDTGRGIRNYTGERLDSAGILDAPLSSLTGDIRVRASGFIRNYDVPLYRIEGRLPLPVHILSITQTVGSVR